METNNRKISDKDHDSILNHIINCANCALKDELSFKDAMIGLAHEFRTFFQSEYCAIGTVIEGIAEIHAIDYIISYDEQKAKLQATELESVRSADAYGGETLISIALESSSDISSFDESFFINSKDYNQYKIVLDSGKPKNSIVIPIRYDVGKNFGYIQFININDSIDYERFIRPYKDALLGLVQIIINNQKNQRELVKRANRLKDADFYNLMQEKRDNVDDLLDSIMAYFSNEFNAAVISFRIPSLNGYNKDLLFYLRRVFIHQSIGESKRQELIKRYNNERFVKNKSDMNVIDELRYDHKGKILESKSDSDFSEEYGLDIDNQTLIMPIFRDIDVSKYTNPSRKKDVYCNSVEHRKHIDRFKRLYGIFRLRISNTNLSGYNHKDYRDIEETKIRLAYLSKQITLLLNSIVNRHENESLQIFRNELKSTTFIKIKDFDKRCVEIICKSVFAKICSIYRYDERTKQLSLSATTASIIHFKTKDKDLFLDSDDVKDSCFVHAAAKNNLLIQVLNMKQCLYVLNIKDTKIHQSHFIELIKGDQESAMAIPMITKDGTCAGVVLLIGKEQHNHAISTTYWEYDIKNIEFIVSILTRISESDTERLTFLSQLSHELLAPVTELVYDNDYTVNVAERNPKNFPRQKLISKLRENIDRSILFKYIISDTEFIYSSIGRNLDYNIIRHDKPQTILLDAIRLLEKEAHTKGLTIRANISAMPPLYFDKERMMQVFLNLLKNAIKYSDNYSTIDIFYKNGTSFHEIRFANFGIGIPEEEKETIFELFYRGEEAKQRFVPGTGMGLYIVRDIMRAHGGDCYVRRLINPTEFAITLPNKE